MEIAVTKQLKLRIVMAQMFPCKVRAELFRGWKHKSNGFDIEVELNSLVDHKGYPIAELPIDYRLRLGKKSLHLVMGLNF